MAPSAEQRTQVDFLKRELEAGIRMANLAVAEWSLGLGETAAAKRAAQHAQRAYAAFRRFLPTAEDYFNASDRAEIDSKRSKLEGLLKLM